MVKIKFLSAIFCAAMLWAGCSGSQSNNGTNADNSNSSSTASKTPSMEDLWKSYLKSEYCDIESVDADAAVKLIKKQGANSSKLILDFYSHQAIDEDAPSTSEPEGDDEFSESDDSALGYCNETLSTYNFKDGGLLVVVYSELPMNGRNLMQMFKYNDGKLTRLKDIIPEFTANVYETDLERFEGDKFVKYVDTEVAYLSTAFLEFTPDGFSFTDPENSTYKFKWNGESFE